MKSKHIEISLLKVIVTQIIAFQSIVAHLNSSIIRSDVFGLSPIHLHTSSDAKYSVLMLIYLR